MDGNEQTEVKSQEPISPEDAAAAFFALGEKKLNLLFHNMSKKQIANSVLHALTYPIGAKDYSVRTDEQKQAAYLIREMSTNMAIMQLTVEMQKAEKAQQQEEQPVEIKNILEDLENANEQTKE